MRILLTGTTGQVGRELGRSLQGLGTLMALDRNQMDLADPAQVRAAVRAAKPDLIINPAAYTAVDKAESEPELAMRVNGEAPGIMAEEAHKLGAAMIHFSTDYVFDGAKRGPHGELAPYTEADTPNPINVYGSTKLAGEKAIAASGCSHIILRTSWVYSSHGKNFLSTMLRLAKTHAELKVVEDQWGAPTWAGWIADATAQLVHDSLTSPGGSNDKQAMNKADGSSARQAAAEFFRLHGGIYNFVNSGCTTWRHFAEEIFVQASRAGLLGGAAPVVLGIGTQDYPTPAKRPGNSMLSLQALGQNLKIQPPTWQSSLSECFKGLQP